MEVVYFKFKVGGGFEILRSGIGSSLVFVLLLVIGYFVFYLRD